MKVAELSATSGATVATLKYYLREGLLHPGHATAVNQAEYDDTHVRRVRLIRALQELGKLGLADVALVLAAVDDESIELHAAFGLAQDVMVPNRHRDPDTFTAALADVDRFVLRHDFHLRPDAAVRLMMADAIVALQTFGGLKDSSAFDRMVESAKTQAAAELATVPDSAPRSQQMELSVVGTVVTEIAAAAVRRMALEDASWRRFGPGARPPAVCAPAACAP